MTVRVRQTTSPATIAQLEEVYEAEFGVSLGSDNVVWWILEDEHEPVGFATLTLYNEKPDTAFLSSSYISPQYRGLGLQKTLIRVRERYARKLGITRIISYTSYDNYPSANSLISTGFKLYEPDYEWGVKHAYYFRKFL